MSLLYPLYALAALGIAAPVVFHLFQRKPRGHREFSSLLFLRPTPPKVTSRSRLSDLLLLLCRAFILGLVAFAFARPFVRSAALLDLTAPTRSVVLLVDTSASMRRDSVWKDLQTRVKNVVSEMEPGDAVALVRFDRLPQTEISFEAWGERAQGSRFDWLSDQLKSIAPTWHQTDLGGALTFACDSLLQYADRQDSPSGSAMEIILCSDLQEGADLAALEAYQWPSNVTLRILTPEATGISNASLQWLPSAEEERNSEQIRVLVRNNSDSQAADFQLQWEGATGPKPSTHVPPGQSRVVKLKQPAGKYQLTLLGDEQEFDNQAYFPVVTPKEQELWLVGSADSATDRESLWYFLQQTPLNTRRRNVLLQKIEQPTRVATANPETVPFIVVADPTLAKADDLLRFMEQGGRVLLVVPSDPQEFDSASELIGKLFGASQVTIRNCDRDNDYAMLASIDFANPLMQPFADPRFSDFSQIRFWQHRIVERNDSGAWKVVASFDDNSPALVEHRVGEGLVWFLASGWKASDSQLAMSTKFVPLLYGFFDNQDLLEADWLNYVVGDEIPIRAGYAATTVLGPGDAVYHLDSNANAFAETDVPGMYTIRQGTIEYQVAVNLAKEESRTDPMLPGRLEQLGIALDQPKTELGEAEQRQLRSKELEGRQKFWRWGLLGALGLVAGETWLSRRRAFPATDSNSQSTEASQ